MYKKCGPAAVFIHYHISCLCSVQKASPARGRGFFDNPRSVELLRSPLVRFERRPKGKRPMNIIKESQITRSALRNEVGPFCERHCVWLFAIQQKFSRYQTVIQSPDYRRIW